MRHIHYGTRKLAAWLVLVLPGLVTPGCDRPLPVDPVVPGEKRILMLVEDVDDFSQNKNELERIKRLFVPGSEPSKEALLRYMAYRYEGKSPVESGDSGSITVIVKDAKTGGAVGEVQWSIAKFKGAWKLTAAPLPAK